jgi:hypothetical protein
MERVSSIRCRGVMLGALLAAVALFSPAGANGDGCPLPCSGQSSSPASAKYLYVQPEGEDGRLLAYDTRTGKVAFGFPAGRASGDGLWFHTAAPSGRDTAIARWQLGTGRAVSAWTLPGRWRLAGVSPGGAWLALARGRTEIAIVDAATTATVHRLRLEGDFEVETVSADGRRLFLIEHLDDSRYLVRLYDLRGERLVANPLRAKGEDRIMAGLAWSGVASPDGRWLLTLYLNTSLDEAFVHALDLVSSQAVCIDLPSGTGDLALLKRYALKLSPDARRLYAANPALGVVAEIDLPARRVVEQARFVPGHVRVAPGRGATATISRDGRRLVFTGGRDLWRYDTRTNRVGGPLQTGGRLLGLGFGAGDRTVHALRADGRLLSFAA